MYNSRLNANKKLKNINFSPINTNFQWKACLLQRLTENYKYEISIQTVSDALCEASVKLMGVPAFSLKDYLKRKIRNISFLTILNISFLTVINKTTVQKIKSYQEAIFLDITRP